MKSVGDPVTVYREAIPMIPQEHCYLSGPEQWQHQAICYDEKESHRTLHPHKEW